MRPWLSVDLETTGRLPEYALQPWRVKARTAWATTVAFTERSEEGLMLTKGRILHQGSGPSDYDATRASLKMILDYAIAKKARLLGWNFVFDLSWFLAYELHEEIYALQHLDGMLLWKHLDSEPTWRANRNYRLDTANKAFEKAYVDYKHDVDYHDPTPEARKKLLAYNRNDVEATLLHAERFWHQLTGKQQQCALTEAHCLPMVAQSNLDGMVVDLVAREKLANTLADVGHKIAEIMAPLGVTEKDVRSPARTRTLFYKKWQLPVLKYTWNAKEKKETETPSTDKDVIDQLATDDDRVYQFGMWREALNLRSKFMSGLERSTDYNDEGNISHPQAIIAGTYTSRMTYSSKQGRGEKNSRPTGFALHQMKNDPRFRGCILPPEADDYAPEGYDLFEADAAGQEFRWMAILSGDPTMLDLCQPGGDPHTYLTAQIFKEDYAHLKALRKSADAEIRAAADKKRKLGKVGNLSLQYRTTARTFRVVARVQNGLKLTEDEASNIHLTYRQTYVQVPIYWKTQIQKGKELGFAETLAGRRVRVEGDWKGTEKWSMESTMINYPIQGTGGEQKYLALRCLRPLMSEFGVYRTGLRFGWDLHDGLYFYVPKRFSLIFAERARAVLDNLPYEKAWGFRPPIPLPWDIKLGPRWGHLEEVAA